MVLDAKALTWAAKNNIDTAKLKAAQGADLRQVVLPRDPARRAAGQPRDRRAAGVSRAHGRRRSHLRAGGRPAAGRAGARGLLGHGPGARSKAAPPTRALRTVAPEPLLAMARPPGYWHRARTWCRSIASQPLVPQEPPRWRASTCPARASRRSCWRSASASSLLGAITNPIILVVGLLWMLAGAIAWIRIGLLESRAAAAHAVDGGNR